MGPGGEWDSTDGAWWWVSPAGTATLTLLSLQEDLAARGSIRLPEGRLLPCPGHRPALWHRTGGLLPGHRRDPPGAGAGRPALSPRCPHTGPKQLVWVTARSFFNLPNPSQGQTGRREGCRAHEVGSRLHSHPGISVLFM